MNRHARSHHKTSARRKLYLAALAIGFILVNSLVVTTFASSPEMSPSASPIVAGCPPLWRVISSPNVGTSHNVLYSVAAASTNDVWAAGATHNAVTPSNLTLTMHWDGTSWTVVSSPNVGISNNQLRSVAEIAINDVWAVGFYSNTITNPNQNLTMHWDGTSWTVVSSPNVDTSDNVLFSVAATSTNNVWAVGFYSNTVTSSAQTLTEHSDGTSWTVISSPNVGTSHNQLRSVAVISSNDIWAVGVYSNTATSAYQTLTTHWDGANWTVVPSPNVGTSDNVLYSVAAISTDNVWAGGYYSNTVTPAQQTLITHWDGTSWTVVPSPNNGTSDNDIFSVAATPANDVWAVGYYSNTVTSSDQTLTMHWNGTNWTIVPSPNVETNGNQFRGVAATSANDVWAVGRYYSDQSIAAHTLVENSKCVNFFPLIMK